jgi:hypothetical protein
MLAVLAILITVSTQRVAAELSVSSSSLVHATSPHTQAVASSLVIPAALRTSVAAKLGGLGLRQSVAHDAGLHVSVGAKQVVSWSLTPTSWGRIGSTSTRLNGANPLVAGDRTTYAMGALTAWYHSSLAGIEQGFVIARRPGGTGGSVSINLRSAGDLRPELTNGRSLSLETTSGKGLLTYGALSVRDASGRAVPAHLTLTGDRVAIVIDDRTAQYPLTVDPVTQVAELTPSVGSSGATFGTSISLSANGHTALIGAFQQDTGRGGAYVFQESGGQWTQQAELTASVRTAHDLFGVTVALSANGTEALIGADGTATGKGAAYIFTLGAGQWTQQAQLTAADGLARDAFGISLALSADGSTALIGASGWHHSSPSVAGPGAAYIYSGSGSQWTQEAQLTAADGIAQDDFGDGVALSTAGTEALIGADGHQVGANSGQGAEYVFEGSGAQWLQVAEFTASDGGAGDSFGVPVALSSSGGVALIGSGSHTVGGHAFQGAAYVFSGSGSQWIQNTELTSADGAADDGFGDTVALSSSGTTALIGAYTHNDSQGSAYQFNGSGSQWTQTAELTASDGVANDNFGWSVALSAQGTLGMVGAVGHQVGPNTNQGVAYVFVPTASASNSVISSSPSAVAADGASTSTVTVQAEDAYGNNLTTGGATVNLSTSLGRLGPVTDNGDGTYSATLTSSTAPGTATVTGTINGSAIGHTATVAFNSGYWTVAGDGGVFSFGPNFYGSTGNLKLNQPVFAITSTADGKGYWFVARDGGVFTYGDGVFHGSVPALGIHVTNIVGMAADTATGGYWLVGSDGGVYAFGAPFDGSIPGLHQHVSNIVGIAATADGGGYYLVASTGAVYAFGDAKYQGGANTLPRINAPIVGITVDSATGGYWLAGSDGGIYAYGAPFHGSAGGTKLNQPIVGIDATTDGSGYYLVAGDGGVFSYNAPFLGSMGGKHLNAPMVGITVAG